ncbi:MAG: hypothetical protein FWB86_08695 [Treponema sp.]|nr:hypothetical protein [Treponema sp.]MCL2252516.1 hypothetical protein [Treponema sp.]
MKNAIKLIAITLLIMAAAVPVFAGGSRDRAKSNQAASTLIITGLEAYNGMFIMVKTRGLNFEGIQAGARIVENDVRRQVEGVRIANGRASLTVWSNMFVEPEGVEVGDLFTGSAVKENLEFIIWSGEEAVWEWSSKSSNIIKVFDEFRSLKFTNGSAAFNGSDLPPYDPNN